MFTAGEGHAHRRLGRRVARGADAAYRQPAHTVELADGAEHALVQEIFDREFTDSGS
jgi:hypothetical protein